jgi:hypothetical protein
MEAWNSHCNISDIPVSIAGKSDPVDIANEFKSYFDGIYVNSAANTYAVDEYVILRDTGAGCKADYPTFGVETLENCVKKLKLGRVAGVDGITAEHIIHSFPSLYIHLKSLFNIMINHSYVPNVFGCGIGLLIPITKDKTGNAANVENYRPITLCPVISKLFEMVLLELYSDYLATDDLQSGFKKHLECPSSIFTLRQIVNYYNERGSNVYIASLDAAKAFDSVNHFKLFSALLKKGLPFWFVDIIANWYLKLSVVVRWNGFNSGVLRILSGVRQGGVLSPSFFNVYIDSVINRLRTSSLGCYYYCCYVGCIMYADDILLLSASVIDLQHMLDLCGSEGNELGITFNIKKSHCLVIGPKCNLNVATMSINGITLTWVDKISYLGIVIAKDKHFTVDSTPKRRNFYSSVNRIFNRSHMLSDMAKLYLTEAHCLPIIMYSLESLSLQNTQLRDINFWWNSIYREIFNYNKWESVGNLMFELGRLDFMSLYSIRKAKFVVNLCVSTNSTLRFISSFYTNSTECQYFLCKNELHADMSHVQINNSIISQFNGRFTR